MLIYSVLFIIASLTRGVSDRHFDPVYSNGIKADTGGPRVGVDVHGDVSGVERHCKWRPNVRREVIADGYRLSVHVQQNEYYHDKHGQLHIIYKYIVILLYYNTNVKNTWQV